jgi:sulfide:quinone oxidoreductase
MANILILGGGFGALSAAESLLENLTSEHQITLVSRSQRFVYHPSLVDLAFGNQTIDEISHDLRDAMHNHRIRFVRGEVARVDPHERRVTFAHGDITGSMHYDYVIFALGGRLATERIPGFYEHAHHPLTVEAALKFGEAIQRFDEGRVVIGYSQGARLVAPVYKTVFAFSRLFEDRPRVGRTQITVVRPKPEDDELTGPGMGKVFRDALEEQKIELADFSVNRVTQKSLLTSVGGRIDYDLLMLLPPFVGSSAVRGMGITDPDGFIRVNKNMQVDGVASLYAVGDCVSFPGPKMSYMALSQGEVAGANLAAEVESREFQAEYDHKTMLALDQAGQDSILNKHFWMNKVKVIKPRDFNKYENIDTGRAHSLGKIASSHPIDLFRRPANPGNSMDG